jgi:glycosyltransferase involved in cell wall biosynthesis
MRILWLGHRDLEHPNSGGAERTLYEVGRRLVVMGHAVNVLTAAWTGAPSRASQSGIQIRRYPTPLVPHLVLPLEIARTEPDVIVDDLAHAVPWCSPLFTRRPGVAFFHHLHARTLPGQVGPFAAATLSFLERRYSLIYRDWRFVTESPGSFRDIVALGVASRNCERIEPGVDLSELRPGQRSPFPTVIYFAGMRRYKRPDAAVRAFAQFLPSYPQARLVVVGEGGSTGQVRELSSALGVGPNVEFAGRLSRRDIVRQLASAWVNVHCSVSEGWGLSTVEAAAAGVPTVAFRVPGIEDSVVDGVTGRLVPDGDIGALSEGLLEIVGNMAPWPDRCRSHASKFSWEAVAGRWEKMLELTASSGPPSND